MTALDAQQSRISQPGSRRLFYPCAGNDIQVPVERFFPEIDDFWFADIRYTARTLPRVAITGFRMDEESSETCIGTTIRNEEKYRILIVTHHYSAESGVAGFRVHFCRGRGYDVFRTLLKLKEKQLSVFFYRGDSPTDGGSGFLWLMRKRLRNVLEILEPGGLIVSDGSNAIPELSEFHRDSEIGQAAVERARSFTRRGRVFRCVGYAGERYGPTLVWQVTRE